jgi:L-threonylcarbamoyladenylate synthase
MAGKKTVSQAPVGSTRLCAPDPASIARAGRIIANGGLVAFPTETVYGLGADATSTAAVQRLYATKGRPSFNPLIAHVADLDAAQQEGVFDAAARQLADRFWPGPLTLVVPAAATTRICALARAGLASVALRVPSHPMALSLINASGRPIAAPSANPSGRLSATSAAHVAADFGDEIDLVLDGGPATIGIESSIVACLFGDVRLLRPGGLTRAAIEAALGRPLGGAAPTGSYLAPGMLDSHYAPRARLRLEATGAGPGESVLDFGGQLPFSHGPRLDLSSCGDSVEAATNLFAYLRALDQGGASVIAVAPIPARGLGEAINDRLRRAAAPRP